MKLYQSLLNRIDEIVEIWVHRVEEDEMINSDTELTYLAIRDNIPDVLQGLAIRLHDTDRKEDPSELLNSSFEHGELRAEQGFNPEEIAREYRILRKVLHEELSEDLVQLPQKRLFEAVQIINDTIDGAIARCFQSYMNAKLKNLEELQKELVLTNQELT